MIAFNTMVRVLVVFFLLTSAACYTFTARLDTLSCDRGDGRCTVTNARARGAAGQSFAAADLSGADRRLVLALAMTMLVGLGWELAQTTVVGHNARLADLVPDLVAAGACLAIATGLRHRANGGLWPFKRQPR